MQSQDSTGPAVQALSAEANPTTKRSAEDSSENQESDVKKARLEEDNTMTEASTSAVQGTSSTTKKENREKKRNQGRRAAREARNQDKQDKVRRGTRPEGEEREDNGEKGPRLPKRQCALLLGFCGSGYSGMQMCVTLEQSIFHNFYTLHRSQKDVRTIEGTLFDALVRAGAVSQDNADNPAKVNFNRAARTDAGVHAAGNLVSMKLITAVPGVPDMVARINEELPPEIRLWNFVRRVFSCYVSCNSETGTYSSAFKIPSMHARE